MLAMGALAGMGVEQAAHARPDRSLEYDLEITTTDNRTLVFKGTTECPHRSTTMGAGYRTDTPETMITVDGEKWILSGIDCHNEIVDKGQRRFVLYKIVDDHVAKTYFVAPGGSASLTKISVESSIAILSSAFDLIYQEGNRRCVQESAGA
jgi:hypothetical protein